VDAGCAFDEWRGRGRRSRVVLTPRRWRQVATMLAHCAYDGGKQARSPGRARRKPLKPLRGECRAFSGVTVVTNARVYYPPRAAAGASGARHSLRPLFSEGRNYMQSPGAKVPRECGGIRGCHRPPPGLAFGEPDDRLQRAIQYSRDASDRTEKPQRDGYPPSWVRQRKLSPPHRNGVRDRCLKTESVNPQDSWCEPRITSSRTSGRRRRRGRVRCSRDR
jgi:hypothetical protein